MRIGRTTAMLMREYTATKPVRPRPRSSPAWIMAQASGMFTAATKSIISQPKARSLPSR